MAVDDSQKPGIHALRLPAHDGLNLRRWQIFSDQESVKTRTLALLT
jgi:hypothetical protein